MNRSRELRRRIVMPVTGLLGVALAGCGEDATGPGGAGRVRTVMYDRPSASAAVVPGASYLMAGTGGGSLSGSMTATASVSIAAEGGAWIEIGRPRPVTYELQSTADTTEVHGGAEVPAGTYSRVRIVMSDARVNLAAGSVIGGLTLTGSISIIVGGGSDVVIEKRVEPFRVSADARTQIEIDLNSEAWVTAQSAEQRAVAASEMQSAMTVAVRSYAGAGR